jgi:hypothetical protein
VAGGHALECLDVAQGVGRLLRRQVGAIGLAFAGRHPGMDLDELAPEVHPHQGPVGPHVDVAADELPGTE